MTTVYYTADSVGVGVRITVTGGNNLFVGSGVVIGSSDMNAIGIGGTDNGIDIYGTVLGELGGISLLNATNTSLNIWQGASVGSSNDDAFGIAVNNSSAEINNFGTIHGDTAIDLLLATDCNILNRGEIRGEALAIDVDVTATGEIMLVNTGSISVALESSAVYNSAGAVEDVILNDGRMNGPISLGPGNDRYMGASAEAMDEGYYAFVLGLKISSVVSAGAGRDLLEGGRYLDLLHGGEGRDMMMGLGSSDQLAGGGAADLLAGGAGGDIFVYSAPGESRHGRRDTITDFSRSQGDAIELGTIDADVTRAGNQQFDFIGQRGFRGPGELRFEYNRGNTIIEASVDGDRQSEMEIEVRGHIAFSVGDFGL